MIESLQNEQVKYVVSLQRTKTRKEARLFVVEGWRFVWEALRRKAAIKKVMVCLESEHPQWQSFREELTEREIPMEEVSQRVFRKMSATKEPQGILALVRQESHTWADLKIEGDTVLLVVDGIQDPGNLGAILRTALASGVKYVCLTAGTVDLYNAKVLRSTMGAIFSLVVLPDQQPETILEFCRDRGVRILTGDIQGGSLLEAELADGPLALVVGNEGSGLSAPFRSATVCRLRIPMAQGVESLNVSIAAGILLYEIRRQRYFRAPIGPADVDDVWGKGDELDK